MGIGGQTQDTGDGEREHGGEEERTVMDARSGQLREKRHCSNKERLLAAEREEERNESGGRPRLDGGGGGSAAKLGSDGEIARAAGSGRLSE